MQIGRSHRILQAERIHGTSQGLVRNASILIAPEGCIAAISPSAEMERDRREREAADPAFRPSIHRHEVILPALTDAHNHPILWGEFQAMRPASLSAVSNEAHLARSLKAQLDGRPGLQLALGWDTAALPALDRHTLDAIHSEPLVAMDQSFHGACANSSAMRLIAEHLQSNPPIGPLAGEMTSEGRLTEHYAALGFDLMEERTEEETLLRSIEAYVGDMFASGTAYAHEMNLTTRKQLTLLKALPSCVRETIRILHIGPGLLRSAIASGAEVSGFHLKLFADGSNGSRTALYYEPYLDTDRCGIQFHREQEACEAMELALEHGIRSLAVHAIGDRGIDIALGFCERWRQCCRAKGIDGQARIEHMSVPRSESISRAANLGVSVSPQPNFILDMIPFADRLEEERLGRMVPMRKMLNAGLRVMLGTDGMPNSMLLALHCAVTAPLDSQRLSLEEALHCATATAADYEGASRGRIVVGQPADLLMTSHRLVEMLEADSGLYRNQPETLSGNMDEMAAALRQEVRALMGHGQLLRCQAPTAN